MPDQPEEFTSLTEEEDSILKHLAIGLLTGGEKYAELRNWLVVDRDRFVKFAHFLQDVMVGFKYLNQDKPKGRESCQNLN